MDEWKPLEFRAPADGEPQPMHIIGITYKDGSMRMKRVRLTEHNVRVVIQSIGGKEPVREASVGLEVGYIHQTFADDLDPNKFADFVKSLHSQKPE